MKRVFLAIPAETTLEFIDNYDTIRDALYQERINWVHKDNLHLTLHFFGETSSDLINEIISNVKSVLSGFRQFKVIFKTLGVFKNIQQPRVIWIGCTDQNQIKALKDKLDEVFRKSGISTEDRDF